MVQEVDIRNHSWANYFICAYKVHGVQGLGGHRVWGLGCARVGRALIHKLQGGRACTLRKRSTLTGCSHLQGVHELLEVKHGCALEATGLQVLVHGVIPTGVCVCVCGGGGGGKERITVQG